MSIFSIPSMIMSFSGTRVPYKDRDYIGLYKLTLGNIGYDTADGQTFPANSCKGLGYDIPANSTCVGFFGTAITMVQAGEVITACEFIQICIFFLTLFYLSLKSEGLTNLTEGRDCVVSDYSIMVTNLPPDVTSKEIIDHFSKLYQLKAKDWRNRPPLAEAEPVTSIENSGCDLYKGTWVADVTLFRKIGSLLRAYLKEEDHMEELFRYRAYMKMYNQGTKLASGPNPRLYK